MIKPVNASKFKPKPELRLKPVIRTGKTNSRGTISLTPETSATSHPIKPISYVTSETSQRSQEPGSLSEKGGKEIFDVVSDSGDTVNMAVKSRNNSRVINSDYFHMNDHINEDQSTTKLAETGKTSMIQIKSNETEQNPVQSLVMTDSSQSQQNKSSSSTSI